MNNENVILKSDRRSVTLFWKWFYLAVAEVKSNHFKFTQRSLKYRPKTNFQPRTKKEDGAGRYPGSLRSPSIRGAPIQNPVHQVRHTPQARYARHPSDRGALIQDGYFPTNHTQARYARHQTTRHQSRFVQNNWNYLKLFELYDDYQSTPHRNFSWLTWAWSSSSIW